jgi:hypothetical protein
MEEEEVEIGMEEEEVERGMVVGAEEVVEMEEEVVATEEEAAAMEAEVEAAINTHLFSRSLEVCNRISDYLQNTTRKILILPLLYKK